MLGLKPYLAARPRPQPVSLTDLPAEIIDLILEIVYIDGGQRPETILSASRVSRELRKSALSILCREILCVLREDKCDSRYPPRDLNTDHLLRHGRTLCVRTVCNPTPTTTISQGQADAIRSHRMQVLQHTISRLPKLQLVRVQGSLSSAIDLLSILKDHRDVAIHLISVFSTTGPGKTHELVNEFNQLLEGRTLAIGTFNVFPNESESDKTPISPPHIKSLQAITLDVGHIYLYKPTPGLNCPPFPCALSTLEEVWLNLSIQFQSSPVSFDSLLPMIPWSNLKRLHIQGSAIRTIFHSILPRLSSLRNLHLGADRFLSFHYNCPYVRNPISSKSAQALFEIDFTSIPRLHSLSIEGMCSHVPIMNVVCPSLRSLKLHRPYLPYPSVSVGGASGQRTPADLLKIARIAPCIERLGLDIGSIENLWHPTAIPGINVDPKLYSFLATLSNFHHLRTLYLFPPHLDPDSGSTLTTTSSLYCLQLCSDQQVIRLFNHLRQQNRKLSMLMISPALMETTLLYNKPIARTWEVRSWGEKTLLVTRQMGNDYELRQMWIGERKLSSEVKRDGYQKGLGVKMERDDDWVLQVSPRM
ncbi:hypothetical protein DV736_g5859, partial [Chaetothyriales sp. CBS 134916]